MKTGNERQEQRLTAEVPLDAAGLRLDQALAQLFPDFSRTRLQRWLSEGLIFVDDKPMAAKGKVVGGEQVVLYALESPEVGWQAEDLPLNVVYEDAELIVINKSDNCVVHPAVGHASGTLVNALLHRFPELNCLPRAGIVHRLDKDTTGLMVVARSLAAHTKLVKQLQAHTVSRVYLALVKGQVTAGGTVDAALGRHPSARIKRAVVHGGKPARTQYRVEQRFAAHTLLRLQLETGRTHQIRVHMAHIGHPLVGDPLYGGRLHMPPACSEALRCGLQAFKRQALHAEQLALIHPSSGEHRHWQCDLPDDFQQLLALFQSSEP